MIQGHSRTQGGGLSILAFCATHSTVSDVPGDVSLGEGAPSPVIDNLPNTSYSRLTGGTSIQPGSYVLLFSELLLYICQRPSVNLPSVGVHPGGPFSLVSTALGATQAPS